MNIYVWKYSRYVTSNYHDGGGVLVVAPTLERARQILENQLEPVWRETFEMWGDELQPGDCEAVVEGPYRVWPTYPTAEEEVIIFPDKGCC